MVMIHPNSLVISSSWQDLVETVPDLANAPAWIQNQGPQDLLIAFSDAAGAPSDAGYQVKPGISYVGKAAHIFVKATVGDVKITCGIGYEAAGGGGGSGGDGSAVDRELVVTSFVVTTAFTGAALGDTITSTQIIDISDEPMTVAVIWRNQSKATDLAAAPSIANLQAMGVPGLTDAQIRATALPVTGPLTNSQLTAVTGTTTTAAWDGVVTTATASVIGILKAIWAAIRSLAPASSAIAVVPSDLVTGNLATPSRALYVGVGGDISVQIGGSAVVHKNVPSGSRLDVVATRVNATGTSATDIVSWS